MPDGSTTLAHVACDERTARQLADALAESLDAEAAVCAAFEDASGHWRLEIHFRDAPDQAAVRTLAALTAGDDVARAIAFETVAAADWVAASLAGLKPVAAGRFLVHGAHDRSRTAINRIGIEIEAALAFGTGHHGTTRGCLVALDDLAKRKRPRNVLDLGTGSGVLAIAAAKTLHSHVVATDIDPSAIVVARANATLNRAGSMISFVRAGGARARAIRNGAPFDLIFANILLAPLVRMAVDLSRLAASRARIVLSGLLPDDANAVLSIYRAQGLMLERRITLEAWATLVLVKH